MKFYRFDYRNGAGEETFNIEIDFYPDDSRAYRFIPCDEPGKRYVFVLMSWSAVNGVHYRGYWTTVPKDYVFDEKQRVGHPSEGMLFAGERARRDFLYGPEDIADWGIVSM